MSASDNKRRRAPEGGGAVELGQLAKRAKKSLRDKQGSASSTGNRVFNPNAITNTLGGNSNKHRNSSNGSSSSVNSNIDKIKKRIEKINSKSSNFGSRFEKLRGDNDVKQGIKAAENDDYEESDDGSDENGGSTSSLNLVEKFSAMKKKLLKKKEEKYTVEPRYGGWEDSLGIDERRGINYQISKNKGLTPHRKKENRNARVKKRNQYDKALQRRKGAVQEVKVGIGSYYPGEINGIKSDVSKSRKFKG